MEDIDKKWSKNADKTKERIARLQKLHNLRTAGTTSAYFWKKSKTKTRENIKIY